MYIYTYTSIYMRSPSDHLRAPGSQAAASCFSVQGCIYIFIKICVYIRMVICIQKQDSLPGRKGGGVRIHHSPCVAKP